MDRNDVSWKGYWIACPTPYGESGELRLDLLKALIDVYIEDGIHGLLINGTTGEWFSQSQAERQLVAKTAIDHVAGRIPVVVSCTEFTAATTIKLAAQAMKDGAAGVAASPPAYSRPLDEEIVAYYEEISGALPQAPLMVYNWPAGTNIDMTHEILSRLVEIDSVVAVKDSTGNLGQFLQTTRTVIGRARVFGPFMSQAGYAGLKENGGDGFIGGGGILGSEDPRFWEAHWSGDGDYCAAHAKRTDQIFEQLWLPGGWRGRFGHYQSELKAIMEMIGQPGGTVRRPRLPITDAETLNQIREILVEQRILTGSGAGTAGAAA